MVTDGGITAEALQHVLLTDCTPQLVITISGTVYWDDDTIIYPRDPACGLSPSQAHVRIYGQAGAHIIQTAVNGTGASKPIFHVTADNVAIESLVMTGNDIGNIDLVGGSALSFHGASASGGAPPAVLHGGVIREVTFNGWGTAAVDSRWSVGMLIEDNVINCASGAQSYPGSNQSMGISVRNDGLMGGNVIQRNTIRNCLVEAIILEGASGDTVRLNDIDCVATFANGGKCSAGIALAGRITIDSDGWNPCGPAPSSNNLIQSNDIHGPRIQAPIILYGNGPAQYNTVRQNGIYLSRGHGIQIADGVQSGRAENDMCEISTPAIDRSLHAHNVIHNNVLALQLAGRQHGSSLSKYLLGRRGWYSHQRLEQRALFQHRLQRAWPRLPHTWGVQHFRR